MSGARRLRKMQNFGIIVVFQWLTIGVFVINMFMTKVKPVQTCHHRCPDNIISCVILDRGCRDGHDLARWIDVITCYNLSNRPT